MDSRYMVGVNRWVRKALWIAGTDQELKPGIFAEQLIAEALIARGYGHLVPAQLLSVCSQAANADEAQAA